MARKSLIVKHARLEEKRIKNLKEGNKVKWATKHYNRCKVCWRTRSYMREFWICRICFRKYARQWLIAWVRKSSW